MISLKLYQVFCGDCITLTIQDETFSFRLIMDLGYASTYHRTIKDFLHDPVDLLVVSHIDSDHIGGALSMINDKARSTIKEFWYNYSPGDLKASQNGNLISVKQGITLRDYLIVNNENVNIEPILSGNKTNYHNVELYVLSPSKKSFDILIKNWKKEEKAIWEKKSKMNNDYCQTIKELALNPFNIDKSPSNNSSIAFLLTYKSFSILLLGDSGASDVTESLINLGYSKDNKCKVDYMKLSHHGSSGNLSYELLELIDCESFIISTDGSKDNLPEKLTLSKIAISRSEKGVNFFFNYDNETLRSIFTKDEIKQYNISCVYAQPKKNYLEIVS